MLRQTILFALLLGGAAMSIASADIPEGSSLYVGVASNSIFRGVSQTTDTNFYNEGGMGGMSGKGGKGGKSASATSTSVDSDVFAPAIYGGYNYLHSSGLYAGVDATSVNLSGSDAFARVDGYVGYRHQFDSGWRLNAGGVDHDYLGESGTNWWEIYLGTGYGPVDVQVWHDPVNDNTYYLGQLHYEIGSGVHAYFTAGHYSLDVGPDYSDFGVRLSKTVNSWTFGGGIADTTLDTAIPYLWVQYRFAL